MFDLPRVWKFPTELSQVDDVVELMIPAGAKVLSAVNQRETLCIYAECDPQAPPVKRRFRVAGTDHPLTPAVNRRFVGTVIFMGGDFVLHVYELTD